MLSEFHQMCWQWPCFYWSLEALARPVILLLLFIAGEGRERKDLGKLHTHSGVLHIDTSICNGLQIGLHLTTYTKGNNEYTLN